jgi:hypothetical protein
MNLVRLLRRLSTRDANRTSKHRAGVNSKLPLTGRLLVTSSTFGPRAAAPKSRSAVDGETIVRLDSTRFDDGDGALFVDGINDSATGFNPNYGTAIEALGGSHCWTDDPSNEIGVPEINPLLKLCCWLGIG